MMKRTSHAFLFAIFAIAQLAACSDVGEVAQINITDYPEHESDEAKLYVAKCGSCHAAPLPSIHNAKQWSGIVHRMQLRMTRKAIQPLGKRELATVIAYLEKHGRK